MHPIEGNTPALDRPTMILLVLLFVIGFLISISGAGRHVRDGHDVSLNSINSRTQAPGVVT